MDLRRFVFEVRTVFVDLESNSFNSIALNSLYIVVVGSSSQTYDLPIRVVDLLPE